MREKRLNDNEEFLEDAFYCWHLTERYFGSLLYDKKIVSWPQ